MYANFKNQRRKAIKQISFSSIGLTLSSSIQLNAKGIKNPINQFKMKELFFWVFISKKLKL